MTLDLSVLPGLFGVCRLDPDDPLPEWVPTTGFVSITRTAAELSLICDQGRIPSDVRVEQGWCVLQVRGPFDFDDVGVLAAIAEPLQASRVSLLAIATFDTDYILVKQLAMSRAVEALTEAGHRVAGTP